MALSFNPDVVIGNGDMIYWDISTVLNKGDAPAKVARAAWAKVGTLDFGLPMLGTDNETVLQVHRANTVNVIRQSCRCTPRRPPYTESW